MSGTRRIAHLFLGLCTALPFVIHPSAAFALPACGAPVDADGQANPNWAPCIEQYPTDVINQTDPESTTQSQLLQAQNTVDDGVNSAIDTVIPATAPVDAADPVANNGGALSGAIGGLWTAYSPSDVQVDPENVVSGGSATVLQTVGTAHAPTFSIFLRDRYYEDSGTCIVYVERPNGYYFKDDGTLRSGAFGYISCDYQNGFRPSLSVTVQLTGYGPYQFTNPGTSDSCGAASNQWCGIQDVRYFNLECGQRGTYSHSAYVYGTWVDDNGVTHRIKGEGEANSGRYYRNC